MAAVDLNRGCRFSLTAASPSLMSSPLKNTARQQQQQQQVHHQQLQQSASKM
jgi:hypothetical protein